MSLLSALEERSENKCELCYAEQDLTAMTVPPKATDATENQIVLCHTCKSNLDNPETADSNHWRCLNESMWSQVPAVQVMAYRILNNLQAEEWAVDLKNLLFLSEETQEWADASSGAAIIHKDSNGHILSNGDAVVLIQDLKVSGGGFTAKRGTAVKRIRLVPDNANHIEGKVEGQQIVILTEYVKKS